MSKLSENRAKIAQILADIEQLPEDRYYEGKEEGRAEGYEQGLTDGYQNGYAQGDADGQTKGRAEGETIGYENALSKRTELVVEDNGTYEPQGDSTGFKSVSVNLPNKLNQYLNKTLVELMPEDIYGLTEIGSSAFQSWQKLEKVSLPSTVSTIGSLGFYGCSNLKEVSIPDSVIEIKRNAFGSCTVLSKIDLGNGLVTLGNEVFKYAQGFETIVLPSSLQTIGSDCFYAAIKLKEIIVKAKTPPTLNGLLVSSTAKYPDRIIVPIGSGDLYRQATNWSVYADKIVEGDV